MLKDIFLIAFKEHNFYPVSNFRGAQTELQLETEDARLGGPAKLLLFGMRIANGHCNWSGAFHLNALVVVLIEDQKGATVWSKTEWFQLYSTYNYFRCFRRILLVNNQLKRQEKKRVISTYLCLQLCGGLAGARGTQQSWNRVTSLVCCLHKVVGRGGSSVFKSWEKGCGVCKGVWQQWHRRGVLLA